LNLYTPEEDLFTAPRFAIWNLDPRLDSYRDTIFKFNAELFSLSGHDTIRIENPTTAVQDCIRDSDLNLNSRNFKVQCFR
jgi:hypothetical protein